ncbi:MAG: holo-ACP synthase [Acidobacteria bacterium]|jgi:holo-[acyl-carrier protein] synthase|nr:holo-ACP synthase [Acidobacteriota bacterium]
MIIGVGLDLIAVERIDRLLARHGDRFLSRCFSSDELVRPSDPEHLAGLLAAKEAAFKALLVPATSGIGWKDIAVIRGRDGLPRLRFQGRAQEQGARLGINVSHVSITHHGGFAAAVVILER